MARILLVLGAGASFDCAGASSSKRMEWRPPLAKDLFDIENRRVFERVLSLYPGAEFLATELAEQAKLGTRNLEDQLREYVSHPVEQIRRHFLDIPRYLADLIGRVVRYYTTVPGTHAQLCKQLLADARADVVFLTLNYDTFIEQAVTKYKSEYTFTSLEDYIDRFRQVQVFKFHGSIGWFVPGIPHQRRGSNAVTYEQPKGPLDIEMSVHDLRDPEWFPALTLPITGKSIADCYLPPSFHQPLHALLSDCRIVAFIGTSGLDAHMLEFIKPSLHSLRGVHVVSSGDSQAVLSRLVAGLPQIGEAKTDCFDQGFLQYVIERRVLELFAT